MQHRGCKLEYINAIIKKATRPKRMLLVFSIVTILIISIGVTSYLLVTSTHKFEIANPLEGLLINFQEKATSPQNPSGEPAGSVNNEVHIDDIKVTPEFLSYLLNEIGAWQLHKAPFSSENPIINFQIGDETFYSVVDQTIETNHGLSDNADIQFNTNKQDTIKAMLSETPGEVFKQSIQSGNTQIDLIAGDAKLFSKGYLKLYNSLK
ncbi:hypothetical protein CMI37_21090 [Candidatus Pacearchaeota archaeon]|nr:hypothetical protein [Candidatus Pacearchaeota archaeon]